jgi:AcrR family transcriptional regulator
MPRAEREQQLLDIAERAFAEQGYRAVSMDDVAAAAGVTKPMIYAYFGSKEGIFVAGIHRAYERVIERVEEAAAVGGTPAEQLWRVIDTVFAWIDDYRDLWPMVYGAQTPGGAVASEAAGDRAGMVALVARFYREAVPAADAEEIDALAEATVGAVSGLADRWLRHPEEPRELQTQRAVRIVGPAVLALGKAG